MSDVGTLPAWLGQLALCAGLLVSIVIIMVLTLRDRRATHESSSDAADDEPIVGTACVSCKERIRTLVDAGLCRTCERPVHRECLKHHRREAHAPPPRGTYR